VSRQLIEAAPGNQLLLWAIGQGRDRARSAGDRKRPPASSLVAVTFFYGITIVMFSDEGGP
jgi:hypothetical protein